MKKLVLHKRPQSYVMVSLHSSLASDFDLDNVCFQYPTIKLFRHGKVLKKEYRGTRSVDAIKAFLLEQIRDPVQKVTSLEQLNDLTHADRRTKSQVNLVLGFSI